MGAWTQVAVSLSRTVPHANLEAFEAAVRQLIAAASRQPGHLSAEVFRGARTSHGRNYHIVYRFEDMASLRAWDESPERIELAARAEARGSGQPREELSGMEAWFDLPTAAAPPRYLMALLTLGAIWPLVSALPPLLAPWVASLPYLLRTAFTSAVIVAAMTYLIMPWVTRRVLPLIWHPSLPPATSQGGAGPS
jgi:uncharacterized protein